MAADMIYQPLPTNILCPTGANLRLALDKDGDGVYEEDNVNGLELTFQGGTDVGAWWGYDVQGNAAGTCLTPNPSTTGPRSPYDVELNIWLEPGDYTLTRNQSRDWIVTGLESSKVTFEKSWYLHVDAESLEIEDSTGLQGMFDWMQENWWIPLLIAILLLVLVIGFNENPRNSFIEWRHERRLEAVEAEVFEAEILPGVTPISLSQSSPPLTTTQSIGPEIIPSTAATVELVEVEQAEVLEAEVIEVEEVEVVAEVQAEDAEAMEAEVVVAEVVEAEVFESEAVESEVKVVELVEAEIIETDLVGEAEELSATTDDEEELDAFLADFDDDDI